MSVLVIAAIVFAGLFVIVLIVAAGLTALDFVRERAEEHREAKAALERHRRFQTRRR